MQPFFMRKLYFTVLRFPHKTDRIENKFIINWGRGKIMLTTVQENTKAYRSKNTDYDGLWKNLIEELFQEFIEYFASDLYLEIDFKKGIDFKNLELFQFIIDSKKGRNYTDKLVKVLLKNGEAKYVFIHIEVQAIGE